MADTDFRSIALRRLQKGLTQEQLADRLDVRRQTLIALESGKGNPSLEVALDLARALDCAVEDLFRPVALDTLLSWYTPTIDATAHRALLKAKTPFILAGRVGSGKTTLLNSVIAELGPVAFVTTPASDEIYTANPGSRFVLMPELAVDAALLAEYVRAARDILADARGTLRAIVVPELVDGVTTAFATQLGVLADLPVYTTLHVQEPKYVAERLRALTGPDELSERYWGTPGVLWVDRTTKALTVEKLMLIEPASFDAIQDRFAQWCSDVNDHVCRDEIALQYAWSGHTWPGQVANDRDRGNFTNQGRFVHMSAMRDGRILVSGLEAAIRPIGPGERIPHANQLFPGGLATMVSMDDMGSELAARAIVTWLMFKDDELPAVRRAFQQHTAQAITLVQ